MHDKRWTSAFRTVLVPFLSDAEQAAWMGALDADPLLLEFARRVDEPCRHSLKLPGREIAPRHAATVVLRTPILGYEDD